jgi:hypothetical protein
VTPPPSPARRGAQVAQQTITVQPIAPMADGTKLGLLELRHTTFQYNGRLWIAFLPCLLVLLAFGGKLCVALRPPCARPPACSLWGGPWLCAAPTPRSRGETRTHARSTARAPSLTGARTDGRRLTGLLAAGALVAYVMDVLGQRDGTLLAVWMTVVGVEFCLIYLGSSLVWCAPPARSRARALTRSARHSFMNLLLLYAFGSYTLLTGLWATMQFNWCAGRRPLVGGTRPRADAGRPGSRASTP